MSSPMSGLDDLNLPTILKLYLYKHPVKSCAWFTCILPLSFAFGLILAIEITRGHPFGRHDHSSTSNGGFHLDWLGFSQYVYRI